MKNISKIAKLILKKANGKHIAMNFHERDEKMREHLAVDLPYLYVGRRTNKDIIKLFQDWSKKYRAIYKKLKGKEQLIEGLGWVFVFPDIEKYDKAVKEKENESIEYKDLDKKHPENEPDNYSYVKDFFDKKKNPGYYQHR